MPKTKATESYEHAGNFFEYTVKDEPVKNTTSKIPLRKRLEVGAIKMQKLPIALDVRYGNRILIERQRLTNKKDDQ